MLAHCFLQKRYRFGRTRNAALRVMQPTLRDQEQREQGPVALAGAQNFDRPITGDKCIRRAPGFVKEITSIHPGVGDVFL
jgi:hypothetical protein